MTLTSWVASTSGTWSDAANWSGDAVPNATDDVDIEAGQSTFGQYTVTIDTAATADSLLLDAGGAVLEVGSQTTAGSLAANQLTLTAGTLALSDGTLTGTVTAGQFGAFQFDYGYFDTSGGLLDGVTWLGNFEPILTGGDNSQFLNIEGGLTLAGSGGSGPGTATLQNGASLDFIGDQVLDNATVAIGGTFVSNGATCSIMSSSTPQEAANLTLGANLDMEVEGATLFQTDGTITNTGSIDVMGPQFFFSAYGPLLIEGNGTFTNAGTITVSGALTDSIANFVNTGTIDVAGGTLTLTQSARQTWSNTGKIDAAGGTVIFAGTVTTAQLASFEASSGGSLGLAGTLNNKGATLTLGGATLPSLLLEQGGTIEGGTIAGGSALSLDGGTLSGVTWLGNLSLTGQQVTVSNGLKLVPAAGSASATIQVSGIDSVLTFADTETLQKTDIDLQGLSSYGNSGGIDIGAAGSTGASLTLAASSSVQLGGNSGIAGGTLVNDGIIEGQTQGIVNLDLQDMVNAGKMDFTDSATNTFSGFEAYANIATFTNTGVINLAKHIVLTFDTAEDNQAQSGTWVSTGRVNVADAALQVGGTLTTASLETVHTVAGANVILAGVLENTGAVLDIGAGSALGTLILRGTVLGGTLAAAAGDVRFSGGTLSGVTLDNALDLSAAYALVKITNGLDFSSSSVSSISVSGESAELAFIGSQSLAAGTIDLDSTEGTANLDLLGGGGQTTLTLGADTDILQGGADATIYGNRPGGKPNTLLDHGSIVAGVAGGSFTISGDLVNAGSFAASNADKVQLQSGTLTNSGTLSLAGAGTAFNLADAFPEAFVNTGLVAISGGVFNDGEPGEGQAEGDSWSNTGTIDVDGGVLSLNINYTTAGLGSIVTSNGGYIQLEGKLNNAHATLTLGTGTALGGIVLSGFGNSETGAGAIIAGTIVDLGGGIIGAGGTLDGVVYDGTLDLSAADSGIDIAGGIKLHDTSGTGTSSILLTGAGSSLSLTGTGGETLNDTKLIFGDSDTLSSFTSLTLGSKLAISQADDAQFGGTGTIVNDTAIEGSSPAGTIAVKTADFINAATFSLSKGEQAQFSGNSFTNTGDLGIGAGSMFALEFPAGEHFALPALDNAGRISLAGGTLSAPAAPYPGSPPALTNAATGTMSGFGTIAGTLDNLGLVEASGGTLTVQQEVSGQGTVQVEASDTLVLSAGTSSGQIAAFAGTHATIALAPMSFLGTISGFAATDTIGLLDTAASAASFSGDSIIVTLSAGGSLVLDTSTALAGSISVSAGADNSTLLTYASGGTSLGETSHADFGAFGSSLFHAG